MTTQLTPKDFALVDTYYSHLLGTERQVQFAINLLTEYRSLLAYMLRDGVELNTRCSVIIDHRKDIYSYLVSVAVKQDRSVKLKNK